MADEPTIFQKILDGEIPADVVLENDDCLAFRDVNPQAPVHVLVIPKRPIVSLHTATDADVELLGKCLRMCDAVAEKEGCQEAYRVIANSGAGAGQSVFHLHFHVMGGRELSWPPG
ncbi:histidine triad nucleotide-binding protein [Alienimonas chondri]|uniref:Purine nucleoside phosphoramidase n=1 Tax=Alienimonas chondri TaxID=2681879 RepID=A0ABX1VCX9_9PLAN|nr:histidine triad nucleotide-binding protein [Alienimonas chondri]NNJ25747.1 Purine nucleoside phosphoramidase [Alienimonas chondri]